jgi:NDP-sugar pyrophosphorylase family protein
MPSLRSAALNADTFTASASRTAATAPHFGQGHGIVIDTNNGGTTLNLDMPAKGPSIIRNAKGAVLATVERTHGSTPAEVQFFDGKGVFAGIISTPNFHYIALPGAKVHVGGLKLEMAPPTKPLPDALANRTQPMVPEAGPQQQDTNVAMILGAGMSSRFEPGAQFTGHSKPAFPYDKNNAIISKLARQLFQKHGIQHLFVNTYFRPDTVKAKLQPVADEGLNIHYIDEAKPSGSAGAIPKILADPDMVPLVKGKPLVVMSGDSVTNMDISALVRAHQKHNAAISIACTQVADHDLDKFGIILTDRTGEDDVSGRIQKFVEKPGKVPGGLQEIGSSRLANTGNYVISPEVFPLFQQAMLEAEDPNKPRTNNGLDFAETIFPKVMKEVAEGKLQRNGKPMTMWAQEMKGYWSDIGNMPQYFQTLGHVARGLLGDGADTAGLFHADIKQPGTGQVFWSSETHQAVQKKEKPDLLEGNVLVAPQKLGEFTGPGNSR